MSGTCWSRRHPTRWDLDAAEPDHPVRIDHRSGHATVLNSQCLELAGVRAGTEDPTEGVIEREEGTGEPTGVLYEMAGLLRERLRGSGRRDEGQERTEGLSRLNRRLLECGITSVQDAGPSNDWLRWEAFSESGEVGAFELPGDDDGGCFQTGRVRAAGDEVGLWELQVAVGPRQGDVDDDHRRPATGDSRTGGDNLPGPRGRGFRWRFTPWSRRRFTPLAGR